MRAQTEQRHNEIDRSGAEGLSLIKKFSQ